MYIYVYIYIYTLYVYIIEYIYTQNIYIYNRILHSLLKTEILPLTVAWMDLESIMLSELS